MALFDFLRDAGEKLFRNKPQAQQSQDARGAPQQGGGAQPSPASTEDANSILEHIRRNHLEFTNMVVQFDSARGLVTLTGEVPDQAMREKIVLVAGNVSGVAQVDDRLTVKQQGKESKFYTVKSGDTLSKISREFYGDASKYDRIFEANKPMLKDPDKIYPGQNLRIPMD